MKPNFGMSNPLKKNFLVGEESVQVLIPDYVEATPNDSVRFSIEVLRRATSCSPDEERPVHTSHRFPIEANPRNQIWIISSLTTIVPDLEKDVTERKRNPEIQVL